MRSPTTINYGMASLSRQRQQQLQSQRKTKCIRTLQNRLARASAARHSLPDSAIGADAPAECGKTYPLDRNLFHSWALNAV